MSVDNTIGPHITDLESEGIGSAQIRIVKQEPRRNAENARLTEYPRASSRETARVSIGAYGRLPFMAWDTGPVPIKIPKRYIMGNAART
jgi:hypothetical protein